MHQELIIESGEYSLRAQSWGDPHNPRILALHGWLDNSASFAPLAQQLDQFYVLAPDLMGHGYSPHLPSNIPYSTQTHAALLISMLDRLGWQEFSVMGHSLGVGVATIIAAMMTKKVRQLIMIDKFGPAFLPEQGFLEQLHLDINSCLPTSSQTPTTYQTIQEGVDMRARMSNCPTEFAKLIAERDLLKRNNLFASRSDPRLKFKSHRSLTEQQATQILQSIKCPSLLIQAQSGIINITHLKNAKEKLCGLTIADIPGGHYVHMEHPKKIAKLIKAQYETLSRNSAGISCS